MIYMYIYIYIYIHTHLFFKRKPSDFSDFPAPGTRPPRPPAADPGSGPGTWQSSATPRRQRDGEGKSIGK